jgi:Pyridoxamine 5'-phosphate oxidase
VRQLRSPTMGRKYETFTEPISTFIAAQPMFFVATAPLSSNGHVNLSPKGADTLRVTGPNTIVYADMVGSAAETIGHLRENGRITIMWCSFGSTPRILRAYGRGEYMVEGDPDFAEMARLFPTYKALRALIRITVDRIADSCGFGVPVMDLVGQRPRMIEWGDRKTTDELQSYMQENNTTTIDGLPAWEG